MEHAAEFDVRSADNSDAGDRQLTMAEILRPKAKRDKPSLDHLEDAVKFDEAGNPYLDLQVGDKIVIERYNGILKDRPWLDTKPYYINGVDQSTGLIRLYFEELHQHATDNFFRGLELGNVYKKMPANGRWDEAPKVKFVAKPAAPVQLTEHGEPIKKGRGRPKGVKNRPKDVIMAEKKALAEARLAKRAARLAARGK